MSFPEEYRKLLDDPDWVLVREESGGYSIYHRAGALQLIEDDAVHEEVCRELLRLGRDVLDDIPQRPVVVTPRT